MNTILYYIIIYYILSYYIILSLWYDYASNILNSMIFLHFILYDIIIHNRTSTYISKFEWGLTRFFFLSILDNEIQVRYLMCFMFQIQTVTRIVTSYKKPKNLHLFQKNLTLTYSCKKNRIKIVISVSEATFIYTFKVILLFKFDE